MVAHAFPLKAFYSSVRFSMRYDGLSGLGNPFGQQGEPLIPASLICWPMPLTVSPTSGVQVDVTIQAVRKIHEQECTPCNL